MSDKTQDPPKPSSNDEDEPDDWLADNRLDQVNYLISFLGTKEYSALAAQVRFLNSADFSI